MPSDRRSVLRRLASAATAASIVPTSGRRGRAATTTETTTTAASEGAATLAINIYQTTAVGEHFVREGYDRFLGARRIVRDLRSALAASPLAPGVSVTLRAVERDVDLAYAGDSRALLDRWVDTDLPDGAVDANLLLTDGDAQARDEGIAGIGLIGGDRSIAHHGWAAVYYDRAPWLWYHTHAQSLPDVCLHEIGHNLGLRHGDGVVDRHTQSAPRLGLDATATIVSPMLGNYYPDHLTFEPTHDRYDGAGWPAQQGTISFRRPLGRPAAERVGATPLRRDNETAPVVACRAGAPGPGAGSEPALLFHAPDTSPPRDPDLDGVFEDLDNDGALGVGDLQRWLDLLDRRPLASHPAFFDVTGDGQVNVLDVGALLDEV